MSESNCRNKYVRAIHPFKPTHTDELCFQKGDIILVTQMIDGGWWEGTLNGAIGWFPSNYVTETTGVGDGKNSTNKNLDQKLLARESGNRELVLQSLHSAEKAFVVDMERLIQTFLKNIDIKSILSYPDSSVVMSSIEDLIHLHTGILRDLETIFTLKTSSQRIGQLFLKLANQMQASHRKYCFIHPKIAILLQAKKEMVNALMESLGSQSPGSMLLTSYLSKPLRHLERYPSVLQEIDRHSDENHPDREDLLKAITTYREIYQTCNNARRQKEMEQDILCSEIKGWEGEPLSQLGDIQLLSHCRVITLSPSSSSTPPMMDGMEKKDRLLLLCPGLLIMLSVSPRVSGYNFENKLPTYGTVVSPLDENEQFPNAFEIISSNTNVRLLASCTTTQEKGKWLQILRQPVKLGPVGAVSKNIQHHQQQQQTPNLPSSGFPPSGHGTPQSVLSTSHLQSPTTTPPVAFVSSSGGGASCRSSVVLNQNRPFNQTGGSGVFTPISHQNSYGGVGNASNYNPNVVTLSHSHFYLPSLISNVSNQTPSGGNHQQNSHNRSFISNLRPYPPLRPSILIKDDGTRSPRSNRRLMGSSRKKPGERVLSQEEYLVYKKIDDTKVLQEDALMLKVIESYCTSAKNRQAVNSSIFDGPQVLIAEEEKIILEEARDNQIVMEEKTLVDTVYSLREHVKELKQDQQALRKELEVERNARRALEVFVKQTLKSNATKGDPGVGQSALPHPANNMTPASLTTNQNSAINGLNNGSREA